MLGLSSTLVVAPRKEPQLSPPSNNGLALQQDPTGDTVSGCLLLIYRCHPSSGTACCRELCGAARQGDMRDDGRHCRGPRVEATVGERAPRQIPRVAVRMANRRNGPVTRRVSAQSSRHVTTGTCCCVLKLVIKQVKLTAQLSMEDPCLESPIFVDRVASATRPNVR
jgi:hypothetical protein